MQSVAGDLLTWVVHPSCCPNSTRGTPTRRQVIAALSFHPDWTRLDDTQHLDLSEIFKPGQCTVIQLNEIDERDQQVIVATLLRRLNHARMSTERGQVHSGESFLPYPVFVLIEEAHQCALSTLNAQRDNLDSLAAALLKEESLDRTQLAAILGPQPQEPAA